MRKRPLTPGYVFFYILFWPDTWRILIGAAAAFFLAPRLVSPDMGVMGAGMVYVMLAAIVYASSARLASWISGRVRKLILRNQRP